MGMVGGSQDRTRVRCRTVRIVLCVIQRADDACSLYGVGIRNLAVREAGGVAALVPIADVVVVLRGILG